MKDELYREEVDCWVANQGAWTLLFFGIGCIILAVSVPFIHLYVWMKLKLGG